MNILTKTMLLCMLALSAGEAAALAQDQPEPPDMLQIAENEADRLQRMLNLEEWQLFYVDSTLKHDFPAMQAELLELQASKVSNSSLYIGVQYRWMEQIDSTYKTIFTEEQWNTYLKNGAAKAQKAREKRKQKAIEADMKLKARLEKM